MKKRPRFSGLWLLTLILVPSLHSQGHEIWTETPEKTVFENDMEALKVYLERAMATLTQTPPRLGGFADISGAEIERIPAVFKSQGLAFDGHVPVFSWRYGFQRADKNYHPVLTRPLALPEDIQAEYYNPKTKNGFGHIGDIDIAGGKLYAPIEDEDNFTKSYVAIFNPKTLEYTGEKHQLPVKGIPWVAADSARQALYTMVWDSQDLLVFDLTNYKLLRTVPLKVLNPKAGGPAVAEKTTISRVQGAKILGGMLYASSDSTDEVIGTKLKRKRIYKIDPLSGEAWEIYHCDAPDLSEFEGIGVSPDGHLHVLSLAPYYYNNSFPPQFEINGDDWNPSARLIHLTVRP